MPQSVFLILHSLMSNIQNYADIIIKTSCSTTNKTMVQLKKVSWTSWIKLCFVEFSLCPKPALRLISYSIDNLRPVLVCVLWSILKDGWSFRFGDLTFNFKRERRKIERKKGKKWKEGKERGRKEEVETSFLSTLNHFFSATSHSFPLITCISVRTWWDASLLPRLCSYKTFAHLSEISQISFVCIWFALFELHFPISCHISCSDYNFNTVS